MSNETFEPKIVGSLLQGLLVPRGRAGRLGADQVRPERADHPRDVQRAGRSDLRLQGPGHRSPTGVLVANLPSGRMPLHRTKLQGHAAVLDAQAHAPLRWASSRICVQLVWASAAEGQRLADAVNKLVDDVRRLGPLKWPGNWLEDESRLKALEEIVQRTRRGDGGRRDEVDSKRRENWRSIGRPPAAAAKSRSSAIDEKILKVAEAFDVVIWPCATDGKVHDVEKMPDRSIDVCLFNGGIRTSEQEYMAQLMRRKSKVLVAFGSCASEGCIPGLANLNTPKGNFRHGLQGRLGHHAREPARRSPPGRAKVPEGTLHCRCSTIRENAGPDGGGRLLFAGLPARGRETSGTAIVAILEGKLPPKGSVIGMNTTVCDECKRKRNEKKIKKFYRTWQIIPDEETCLLEQGIMCCGIATRAGCKAICPQVNSPCIGCHGPNDGVTDYGARLMSGVASVIDWNDPDEIDRIISEGIPDPVGSFYRFSLARSQLRRKKKLQQMKMQANCSRRPSARVEDRQDQFAFAIGIHSQSPRHHEAFCSLPDHETNFD